eukprot:TRINITY_DN8494_c0_g4_i2.p1 TRINITY_DN8494_c0_g4~~TRINITY_DN8494_c0_g4_i2.p1  ORF type:complete len:279 (-),score=86.01 TRINITY_DN8494_c0_g4_i2:18-854(-)
METKEMNVKAIQEKAERLVEDCDYESAVKCYEEVLLKVKELSEADLAKVHSGMAEAYNEMGDYEQVIEHYKAVASAPNTALASKANCKLGHAYLQIKDYKSSISSYKAALELTKKLLGEGHKSIATLLTFIAMAYQEGEDLKNAAESYKEAIEIYKKQNVLEELGHEYYLLAKCYEEYGQSKEAKENLKLAEEVLIKAKGCNDNMVADCCQLFATVLINNEEYKEALEYLTRTMDIWLVTEFDDYEKIADTCVQKLSLIHICRCRRYAVCRSRWSPYH